ELQAQVRQLDRDLGIQAARPDLADDLEVVPDHGLGAGAIPDVLAQQREDGAHPLPLELGRSRVRGGRLLARHEAPDGPTDEWIAGQALAKPWVLGSPEQQRTHHPRSALRWRV